MVSMCSSGQDGSIYMHIYLLRSPFELKVIGEKFDIDFPGSKAHVSMSLDEGNTMAFELLLRLQRSTDEKPYGYLRSLT